MAGKIFISCGQASTDEKRATTAVAEWLKSEGFEPYVAIQVQSIVDLNAGVIEALKRSDFYLFINFRREMVLSSQDEITRGSLFTQQELAIAYALGFEKMLFLNQQGVAHEGMFSFIVSNTPEFTEYDELLPRVKEAVRLAKWEPSYSRHLIAANLRWSEPIGYIDILASAPSYVYMLTYRIVGLMLERSKLFHALHISPHQEEVESLVSIGVNSKSVVTKPTRRPSGRIVMAPLIY